MISRVRGQVIDKGSDWLEISIAAGFHGLVYKVYVSTWTTEQDLRGMSIELYTHYIVKEEEAILYGFMTRHEKDVFFSLCEIQGIGEKTSHRILCAASYEEIVEYARRNNLSALTKIEGIGKATAVKIVSQLRDFENARRNR